MKLLTSLIIVAVIVAGAIIFNRNRGPTPTDSPSTSELRYLPLGDSYTIGQSVREEQRWPNQLVSRLKSEGTQLQIVANPARTGYTTQDLIDRELPLLAREKPDFVTIQIGVNDWVQGGDGLTFQKNLIFILDQVQAGLTDKSNVVLVTIPDFGKTPAGSSFGDPAQIATGISNFNDIIKAEALKRQLPVADIYDISQLATSDPNLVASDGLHPSGAQYTAWLETILPAARQVLN